MGAFAFWLNENHTVRAPQSYKLIKWPDLIPKDWKPLPKYRNADIGGLRDDDPKLIQMMKEIRKAWDEAPVVEAMQGQAITLPGYIVPLDESKAGLKTFLLVPYFGACIHSPPPPANQIIHIVAHEAVKGFKTMDTVLVSGVLRVKRQNSNMGMSGYTMDAFVITPYTEER